MLYLHGYLPFGGRGRFTTVNNKVKGRFQSWEFLALIDL